MEYEFGTRSAYVRRLSAAAGCQGCPGAFCHRHIQRCPVSFSDLCDEERVCNLGF